MKKITLRLRKGIEIIFIVIAVTSLTLLVFSGNIANGQEVVNKFSDTVLQQIHDLADHRDVEGLLPYLHESNLNYRGEALLCLGSVQAIGIDDSIAAAMNSDMDLIRMAGAFALGQTYHESARSSIKTLLETEEKPLVRGMLYDALGKTGNEDDLNWLAEQNLKLQQSEGQAMGILRFALRGITSDIGNERMLSICAGGSSLSGLSYASYHLGRYADQAWLHENAIQVRQLFENERNELIGSMLIKAVIKAEDEEAWPLVEYLLKSEADYRIKVNIFNGLQLIPWNKVNKLVYAYAISDDPVLSVAAAEAIQKFGVYTDLTAHLAAIKKAVSWRSRTLLLSKGLELVKDKKALTRKIEKQVFEFYSKATTPTEKAWLLKTLAGNPAHYTFVEEQEMKASTPILATYAIETLTLMRKSESYCTVKDDLLKKGEDLDAEFLRIFKRAIQSGDVPAVALACGILRDKDLNYKDLVQDTEFLKTALDKAQDPAKVEARNELIYTLAYFLDKQIPALSPPSFNHPIDWERVKTISPKQQIGILTKKGEIIVQLNVNWCPGTVSAFLELLEQGAFNNKPIHRVVPNFVMQDGCPRGDGWGGPEFTIRSEFTPAPFIEGTFAMASAGKDTEGSQWYITHSPTPHLDAKYTNFGYVVAGMDIAHKLEVGDTIIRIEIIE